MNPSLDKLAEKIAATISRQSYGERFFREVCASCRALISEQPGPFAVGLFVAAELADTAAHNAELDPSYTLESGLPVSTKLLKIVRALADPVDAASLVDLLSSCVTGELARRMH